jgi:hypothetical protein
MTEMLLPTPSFIERDFRVGDVFSKTFAVLSRNVLRFAIVAGITSLPALWVTPRFWLLVGLPLALMVGAVTQAAILHGIIEDLRGRRASLISSVWFTGPRILAVLGAALSVIGALVAVAVVGVMIEYAITVQSRGPNPLSIPSIMLLIIVVCVIIVGAILYMRWLVAVPACVLERLGPWKCLQRSAQLTKGHRWKLFGMMMALSVPAATGRALAFALPVSVAMGGGLPLLPVGAAALVALIHLTWNALYGAFSAALIAVTYHHLRVAKDGVDPEEQIVAVFE